MSIDRKSNIYHDFKFVETGEHARTYEKVCSEHRVDFKYEVGKVIAANGTCVLVDVACGNSTFGEEIADTLPDATVVTTDIYGDIERGFAREGRGDHGNYLFLQSDGDRLPFRNSSVDIVVMTMGPNVYGYGDYTDDESYITEVARILAPGGMAYLRPESSHLLWNEEQLLRIGHSPDSRMIQKRRHYDQIELRDDIESRLLDEPPRGRIARK